MPELRVGETFVTEHSLPACGTLSIGADAGEGFAGEIAGTVTRSLAAESPSPRRAF